MSIVVFDIDGVVADVRHRVHHVEGRQKHWGRFFDAAGRDGGSPEGIGWALRATADHDLVWLTGRPEWLRAVTTSWLAKHGLPTDELIMRAEQDYRPARLLKVAVLNELAERDIVVFVDDDPEVVRAAAAAGFPAALADWMPRGAALAAAQNQAGRT